MNHIGTIILVGLFLLGSVNQIHAVKTGQRMRRRVQLKGGKGSPTEKKENTEATDKKMGKMVKIKKSTKKGKMATAHGGYDLKNYESVHYDPLMAWEFVYPAIKNTIECSTEEEAALASVNAVYHGEVTRESLLFYSIARLCELPDDMSPYENEVERFIANYPDGFDSFDELLDTVEISRGEFDDPYRRFLVEFFIEDCSN